MRFEKTPTVRRTMWSRLLLGLAGVVMATSSNAQVYATATSTNERNGRVIIFRYIQDFGPGFSRATQPDRVILVWKYHSGKGMPEVNERQRMDALEDALAPVLENDRFATLALVSTGENLREWIYYTQSQDEFLKRLNSALNGKPAFPIEIHTASDPLWTTYETFKAGVKK
jgi:hypothetical protein